MTKTIVFGRHPLVIPVLNGIGYPNLFLKPNWLYAIINELFTTDGQGFIDVGANIGQTLMAVKTANRQIHYVGYEPAVSCCYYLKTLIRLNGFADCRVHNFALADEVKELILEMNGEADPTGSVVSALRPAFFSQRESVVAIDYDRLPVGQPITCVKIDVEGGELETLMGMQHLIRRERPYILCEILDSYSDEVQLFTQERADRVGRLLAGLGYSIIQLIQSEATEKIVVFNEIEAVTVSQWRKESLLVNDYIFYPSEKRTVIIDLLARLCC